jgi:hypothetical protein
MRKLALFGLTTLLLGSLVVGCSKEEDPGPKLGEIKTTDGKPLPAEAASATRPQNPFEAAGVAGPGGMKKGAQGAAPK